MFSRLINYIEGQRVETANLAEEARIKQAKKDEEERIKNAPNVEAEKIEQIKNHSFFKDFDWKNIRKIKAPWIPLVQKYFIRYHLMLMSSTSISFQKRKQNHHLWTNKRKKVEKYL